MEALIALSLACNVVQLVDFASKAASECYETYQNGKTIRHQDLATTAQELTQLNNQLQNSINAATTPKPLTREEKELLDLSKRCFDQAQKLQNHLQKLSSPMKKKLLAVISTTLKSLHYAKSVHEIKEHLIEYQQLLDTKILASLYNRSKQILENQQEHLQQLDENQQHFIRQLGDGFSTTKDLIKAEVIVVKHHVTNQHNQTRDHTSDQHTETRDQIARDNIDTREQVIAEHNQTRDYLTTTFRNFKLDEAMEKQKEDFMQSLLFAEINRRQNQIADAYRGTFDWIFDASGKKIRPWDNYVEWLKTGNDVYWINGKAGSGKSTLMNFICIDPRTQTYLFKGESNKKDALSLTFFFWNAGEALQKSAAGLLRSLLYQLLEQQPRLCALLFQRKLELQTRNMKAIEWSSKELISLLTIAIDLIQRPLCLFLDGLDEFAEDEDDLLEFVDKLRALKTVKLCLSSRPSIRYETIFQDCKQLKLQDLTRDSIKLYLDGQLFQSNSVKYLTQENINEAAKLILDKAQGVFLWVKLVIKYVQTGFRNRDPWNYILDRINTLPNEIEQIYERMWSLYSTNLKMYLNDAKLYFSLILQDELSLFQFTLAIQSDFRRECLHNPSSVTEDKIVQHCKDTETYVLVRCAGLLEVEKWGNTNHRYEPFPNARWSRGVCYSTQTQAKDTLLDTAIFYQQSAVRFFHRTGRDFVFDKLEKESGSVPPDCLDIVCLYIESRCAMWCFRRTSYFETHEEWKVFFSRTTGYKPKPSEIKLPMSQFMQHDTRRDLSTRDVSLWITMEETFVEVKKRSSPAEIRGMFSEVYIATDFLGLDAENGNLNLTLNRMSQLRNLDERYLTYLLACTVNRPYYHRQNHLAIVLLEGGANPMMEPRWILEETGRPWAYLCPWHAFMIALWVRTFDNRRQMKFIPELISLFLRKGADLTGTIPVIFRLGEGSPNHGFWGIHKSERFDRLIMKTNAATMLWFMFEVEDWFTPLAQEYGIEATGGHLEVVMVYDGRGKFVRVSSKEDSDYLLELVYQTWAGRELGPEYQRAFMDRLEDVEEGKITATYPEELKQLLYRTLEVIKRCVPVGQLPIPDWTARTSIVMMLQLGYQGQLLREIVKDYKMTPRLLQALEVKEYIAAEAASSSAHGHIE